MERAQVSRSWLAALALAALVVNDHLLKALYPGAVTGKLSDVAGVFVFGVLVATFWPRRAVLLGIGGAVLFVLWKTPAVDPLLRVVNAHSRYPFGRTKDLTDLFALAVLPLALRCRIEMRTTPQRWRTVALAVASLFAFAATSRMRGNVFVPETSPLHHIHVAAPLPKVIRQLKQCAVSASTFEITGSAVRAQFEGRLVACLKKAGMVTRF